MRVVPPYRELSRTLPRRLRWTRARVPTRRHIPKLYRPEGRTITRPSARVSLLHLAATLGVVFAIWGLGALFQTYFAGRIYPHVTIDHVPVGGMTRDEALAALQNTETARINAPIYVQAADKTWQVAAAQFGTRYDITTAVDRALALAHHGPFVLGGWAEAQTIWNGANVNLSGTHDRAAVMQFLHRVAPAVHTSPQAATVGVRGNDVAILRRPVQGRRLDMPGAVAALGAVINTRDAAAVTLPLQPLDPALGYPQANAALQRAHALLATTPIQFQWAAGYNRSWQLTRSGLLRLLTFAPQCAAASCRFTLGIDVQKLQDAFNRSGVAQSVDQAPTNAFYQLYLAADPSNASVGVVRDSDGLAIDAIRAANLILQQATLRQGPHVIWLPTRPLYPKFSTADAQALNFNQNVGYGGVSSMPGLDWARLDNLSVAANVISNTIVQPGHTFSLSAVAGPLNSHGGYVQGQNVVAPGDVTGVHGGVDQEASAVLAAAYDAGLPILRRVHYPYLNAYTPSGFDAMVSYGAHGPDLVFRNTTNHPILLMTTSNSQGGTAVYIFNSAGYAPNHQDSAYTSTTSDPQVTLNQDGSVDTTVTRQISANGHTADDRLTSHSVPIDP